MLSYRYIYKQIYAKFIVLQATDSIYEPGANGFPDGSEEYLLFRDPFDYLQKKGTCNKISPHTEHPQANLARTCIATRS